MLELNPLHDDDLACAGLRRAFDDAVFVDGLGYVDGAIFTAWEFQEHRNTRAPRRVQAIPPIKRAAAAIPKAVKAARAAGLQVARVDLRDDGTVSIVVGEPVAAPEGQGGRSRLDDMLGT
ncbi:hypothetical protein AMST5_01863 [freshwater sediment metagenome]|uniref:Uncharacterized protein n=1 Tax=freshwater sediment metagenome TaxID=556182 RepID=A0AA48LZ22_9ZZZZ